MFGLKNYLTLKQFKVDQQSYETITRLCCKGLWLICLDYQLSTEVIWNPCMHPLSSLPLPISAANCFQRPRERSETHPQSALNFHREGEMEGFPFSLPFLFPPRQTMRPFRLKTYPEVPLPCLLFPPCQLASSTIFMGDEECLSSLNRIVVQLSPLE